MALGDATHIRAILEKGADPYIEDQNGNLPTYYVKYQRTIAQAVSALCALDDAGVDLRSVDSDQTPLLALKVAAGPQEGCIVTFERALEYYLNVSGGIDVECRSGATALIRLCYWPWIVRHSTFALEWLLKRGANANKRTNKGMSVLDRILVHNHHDFLRAMVRYTSDATLLEVDKQTLFFLVHFVDIESLDIFPSINMIFKGAIDFDDLILEAEWRHRNNEAIALHHGRDPHPEPERWLATCLHVLEELREWELFQSTSLITSGQLPTDLERLERQDLPNLPGSFPEDA